MKRHPGDLRAAGDLHDHGPWLDITDSVAVASAERAAIDEDGGSGRAADRQVREPGNEDREAALGPSSWSGRAIGRLREELIVGIGSLGALARVVERGGDIEEVPTLWTDRVGGFEFTQGATVVVAL